MTEPKLRTIVETANPAAVGWNLKGNTTMEITWSRGTQRLYIGFKSAVDGRWAITSIDAERFTPTAPTLGAARAAAHAFFDEGSEED